MQYPQVHVTVYANSLLLVLPGLEFCGLCSFELGLLLGEELFHFGFRLVQQVIQLLLL